MKKVNINSARILKSRLESKLYQLVNKRKEVAVVKILPNENPDDYIDIHIEDITTEINKYIDMIVKLDSKIMEANNSKAVHFDGDVLTIVDALFLAQKQRSETNELLKLSKYKKRSHDECNPNLIIVTSYDPERYIDIVAEQQEKNERLSSAIDNANNDTFIEYDDKTIHL